MLIAIAIVVILLVAALTIFVTASRRRATTGSLSRETRARDQSQPVADEANAVRVDRDRSDRAEPLRRDPSQHGRRGRDALRLRGRPVGTRRRGRARRVAPAVPQPRGARRVGLLGRRARDRDPRLPVADRGERLRRQGERRQASRRSSPRSRTSASPSTSRRRRPTCGRTRRATCPRPRRCRPTSRCFPAWSRGSSRCTSGACTWVAACRGASRRSGSSARATGRSTTPSVRSVTVPRPAGSTASSSRSRVAT